MRRENLLVALGLAPVASVTSVFAGVGGCPLCPPATEPWDSSLGVTNFPRKAAKKQPRVARTASCVLERRGCHGAPEYLIVQRPSSGSGAGQQWGGRHRMAPSHLYEGQSSLEEGCPSNALTAGAGKRAPSGSVFPDAPLASSHPCRAPSPGLLAGLWEFPSLPLAQGLQEEEERQALADHLQAWMGQPVVAKGLQFIGEVSLEPEGCSVSPLLSCGGKRVPLLCCCPAPVLRALAGSVRLWGS